MIALMVILVLLIICATVVLVTYIKCCSAMEIGIFANPKYDERIKKLEEEIKELKEK